MTNIKKFKITISAVLAFVSLVSGCAAYADDEPETPFESAFGGIIQYKINNSSDNEEEAILSHITLKKEKAALSLTSEDDENPTIFSDIKTFKDFSSHSLCITPPEGKIIKGIYIFSEDVFSYDAEEFNIINLCSGELNSTSLELDVSALPYDVFKKTTAGHYEAKYKLAILLQNRPETVYYEYDFDGTAFSFEDFYLEEPYFGEFTEDFVPNEISEEAETKIIRESGVRFGGWIIKYDNDFSCIISKEEFNSFEPYMSFSITPAADNDIVVIILNDREYIFDGKIPAGTTIDLTDEYCVESLKDEYSIVCNSESIEPVSFVTELSQLHENEGVYTADIAVSSIKILKNGVEETITINNENHDFIYVYPAKHTINKAALTITAKSLTSKYTGYALTCKEIDDPVGLVGDNVLDCSKLSVTGSRIDIGTSENIASGAAVLSDDSQSAIDVSMFYDITYVPGLITVLKPDIQNIILSPSTEDMEIIYRGDGITPDTSGSSFYAISGELYPTDSIIVHSSLYYFPVSIEGDFYYTISEYSILRNNIPLSNAYDYYNVTLDNSNYGHLKVLKNRIVISADSYSKPYDGTDISKNSYTITGNLYSGDKADVKISPAMSLHTTGTTENTVISCTILDAFGENVSEYYTIETNPGILEITPRSITITVKDVVKEYNGAYQIISGFEDISLSTALPNSPDNKYHYEMSLDPIGTIKDIGSTTVSVDVNRIYTVNSSDNSENEDVTDQFNITVIPGKLTITPRVLTIKTKSLSSAYTGNALADTTPPDVTGKLDGDKITVKFSGSQTKIGSSDNSCTVTNIVDANNMDVMKNYSINYSFGKLTVYSASTGNTVPLTGDANRPVLFVLLSIFAITGLCAVIATRKVYTE